MEKVERTVVCGVAAMGKAGTWSAPVQAARVIID